MSKPRLQYLLDDGADRTEQLVAVGEALNRKLLTLLKRLETEDGQLLLSSPNIDFVMGLRTEFMRLLQDSGFDDLFSKYLADTPALVQQAEALTASGTFPIQFTKTSEEAFTALQQLDIMQMESRISGTAELIRQQLMTAMAGGQEWGEMAAEIAKSLNTNLVQYAGTYMETARATLAQTIEDMGAEQTRAAGGTVYWAYVGPLDTKTRDECVLGLEQGVFTDDERTAFEASYGDCASRWNCRHEFQQITESEYNDAKGDTGALAEHERLAQERTALRQQRAGVKDEEEKQKLTQEIRSLGREMSALVAPFRPQAQ